MPAPFAFANGRFPGADQIVVDPTDPRHIAVRATFGFLDTRDGGQSWQWICEEVVGQIGNADPPIAVTGDGTIVIAVPFDGVAVSPDHGCSWSRAPPPLAGQLVVDSTLEPADPTGRLPASLLVLTSTHDPRAGSDFQFLTRIVETNDNGRTWGEVGTALPPDFIATTLEVARSDRNRIYVGGVVGNPPSSAIERSLDRGQTWTREMVPAAFGVAGFFVSAIDPLDADRLWGRVASAVVDEAGRTPTTLIISNDRGVTWKEIAHTQGNMYGFALSPDGAHLAYGGEEEGVFVGASDGGAEFQRVSAMRNRGLTWHTAGLYACASEPIDPFAVGLSTDMGQTFEAIYNLRNTCPQACPDDSPLTQTCRAAWTDPVNGVARRTEATGEACAVSWAATGGPGDGGGVDVGADRAESGPGVKPGEAAGGCACTASGRTAGASFGVPIGAVVLALFAAMRRRPRAGARRLRRIGST